MPCAVGKTLSPPDDRFYLQETKNYTYLLLFTSLILKNDQI